MFEGEGDRLLKDLLLGIAKSPMFVFSLLLLGMPRGWFNRALYACFAVPLALLSIMILPGALVAFCGVKFIQPIFVLAYKALRKAIFPVRFSNSVIENQLISSTISSRSTLIILNTILLLEMGLEAVAIDYYVFAKLPNYLRLLFGVYNLLKVNGWKNDRLENFSHRLYAHRGFGREMQQRQEIHVLHFVQPTIPTHSNNPNFIQAWKKAIKQQDLGDALEILQPNFARSGRVQFTAEMQRAYDKTDERLRNGLTQAQISKLEQNNPDLKTCSITGGIMAIPVNLRSNNHDHYFEFMSLLKWFENKPTHPITREQILDLTVITFAADVHAHTQSILAKNRDIWVEAARSNDYSEVLTHLKSIATESNDDAKAVLSENIKHISAAFASFVSGNDNFFGKLISARVFTKLEAAECNKNLLCEITGKFMRNPVYIDLLDKHNESKRYYFDLVALLNWIIVSDKMPVQDAIEQTLDFSSINFDLHKKQEVIDVLRANIAQVILFSNKASKLGIDSDSESESDLEENPTPILREIARKRSPSPPRGLRRRARSKSGERLTFSG